jgi:GT2 family glycosyltransferase
MTINTPAVPDPRVSIIIVNWNGLESLQTCLPSVTSIEYPDFEIVLADNASSDGSVAWVTDEYPRIKIVRHPENYAFSKGNNAAVPAASGELLLFLNNDVEVESGFLTPLVRELMSDPEVAAVQPKLLQFEDRSRFEYAGACGGYLDRFGYPFTRGRVFDHMEADRGQYDNATDIAWASGAAFLVRRQTFLDAGGFDERFYMHMEEVDLCWRLYRMGYRIRVQPASSVYHIGGASLPQGNPRKTYLNFRNNILMLYKNLSPRAWLQVFPLRAALDVGATVRAFVSGHGAEGRAILKAYRDAHLMKASFEADRPVADGQPGPPVYRGAIAADYFLRGKTRFSDLEASRFDDGKGGTIG